MNPNRIERCTAGGVRAGRVLTPALAIVLLLLHTGCAAPGRGSDGARQPASGTQRPASTASASTNDQDCNPYAAALIGGIFGALINERDRAQGAAIGAGIATAGCLAINSLTRQTKSATAVESAYVARNGSLPAVPRVDEYRWDFANGRNVVSSGSEIKTRSVARVVRGASVPLREIREEIRLDLSQAPGGRVVTHAKVLSEVGSPGSGEWVNDFTVAIPRGTPQGMYPVQLALYVNGQLVDRKPGTLQIAQSGSPRWWALASQ